jgi:hypothetical protein
MDRNATLNIDQNQPYTSAIEVKVKTIDNNEYLIKTTKEEKIDDLKNKIETVI